MTIEIAFLKILMFMFASIIAIKKRVERICKLLFEKRNGESNEGKDK